MIKNGDDRMTENKRFLVQIEKNNRSACILDTETIQVYMLVKFSRFDKKESKKAYIENLYEVCNLLNDLNSRVVKL